MRCCWSSAERLAAILAQMLSLASTLSLMVLPVRVSTMSMAGSEYHIKAPFDGDRVGWVLSGCCSQNVCGDFASCLLVKVRAGRGGLVIGESLQQSDSSSRKAPVTWIRCGWEACSRKSLA